MTVEELIAELQKIEDKTIEVLGPKGWAIDGVSVTHYTEDYDYLGIKTGDVIAHCSPED